MLSPSTSRFWSAPAWSGAHGKGAATFLGSKVNRCSRLRDGPISMNASGINISTTWKDFLQRGENENELFSTEDHRVNNQARGGGKPLRGIGRVDRLDEPRQSMVRDHAGHCSTRRGRTVLSPGSI